MKTLQSFLLQSKHGSVKLGPRTRFSEGLLLLKNKSTTLHWKNRKPALEESIELVFPFPSKAQGYETVNCERLFLRGNCLEQSATRELPEKFYLLTFLSSCSATKAFILLRPWSKVLNYNLCGSCIFTTSMDTGFPGM